MKQAPDNLREKRIYANMAAKDTQELLTIWTENDRSEWSNEAFNAIQDILLERMGSLPAQEDRSCGANTHESGEELVDRYVTMLLRSRGLLVPLACCVGMAIFFGTVLLVDIADNVTRTYENIWFPLLWVILGVILVLPLFLLRKHCLRSALTTKQKILRLMQDKQD